MDMIIETGIVSPLTTTIPYSLIKLTQAVDDVHCCFCRQYRYIKEENIKLATSTGCWSRYRLRNFYTSNLFYM